MTLTEEQKRDVAAVRLENAWGALQDAELLHKSGSLRGAANRAYYAMFYSASALAILDGRSFTKHSGLIAHFQREYAKPEVLDRKYGRALQKAFDDRSEADYEDHLSLSEKQVADRVREARDFLEVIRAHIQARSEI